MKKNKQNILTYGGKPHECYKFVPLVVSYTPLSEGVSVCSECGMSVDSETDKKHYETKKD